MHKIKNGDLSLESFIEKNPARISSYGGIKSNLAQLEAERNLGKNKCAILPKRRGKWLYGDANVGKTTLALKAFLGPVYY
jgi:hypothetical protein